MHINQLVIQAKKRDAAAERELFMLLAPKALTMCRRYSIDDHQAKDYTQDVFIKVLNNLESYDTHKGNFLSWFNTICINTILDDKRRKKRSPILADSKIIDMVEITEEHIDLVSDDELLKAIQSLPSGYKEVLNLFLFEKYSHKQIAARLDITESTSRSQLARAKQHLKKLILQSTQSRHERKVV